MNEKNTEADRIREQMAADPHRPLYHFLPPRYWMNDPNGCIQWRGQYHLFYQHNPAAAHWGDIHWGHAASADLVHWQDLPIALAPTPGSPDADGCWSGTACDDNGVPTLVYTARLGQGESVCLATSDDDLRTWRKSAQNPVISGPPPGLDPLGFRDPYVWREAGEWRMALGSGTRASGGCVLLYSSPDLRTWTYLRRLAEAGSPDPDDMWECPSFFPLGGNPRAPDALAPSGAQGCGLKGKHVLIVSAMGQWRAIYFVGRTLENRFVPEREGLRLHIFLDRSVLEVFANDRVCLTSRIYPSRPDSRRVQVTAAGGPARLRMLTAWRMNSIWPDQHTA